MEKDVKLDFALVPFAFPATSWKPSKRITTMQQWNREGFGFLCHPVHEHFECAITSTFNAVNHLDENDCYTLKRL